MRISSLLYCFRKAGRPPAVPEPVHQAGKQVLVPAIGILRETGTLYPYDAEALARRRLHDHPSLEAVYHLGSQLLQAANFGRDVVCLDINVGATLVIYALDLHDGLVRRGRQHAEIAAAARVVGVNGTSQRLALEAGSFVQISGLTVDQDGT